MFQENWSIACHDPKKTIKYIYIYIHMTCIGDIRRVPIHTLHTYLDTYYNIYMYSIYTHTYNIYIYYLYIYICIIYILAIHMKTSISETAYCVNYEPLPSLSLTNH